MHDQTKFTVIVPTRERADTLHYCLQTIVRQKYDNLQILVSDNFSQDDTEQDRPRRPESLNLQCADPQTSM